MDEIAAMTVGEQRAYWLGVKRTWESAGREAVSLAARAPVRASVTEFAASTAVEFDKQADTVKDHLAAPTGPAEKFDVVVYARDFTTFDFESWDQNVMAHSAKAAAMAATPLAIGSRTRFEKGKATLRAVVTDDDGRVQGFEVELAAVIDSIGDLDRAAVDALKAG